MVTIYSFLRQNVLFGCLALSSVGVLAQSNYVATGPSSTTPGTFNTLVGINAGQSMDATGGNNAFFGYQAGKSNTTGGQNTFLGYQAGLSNTTLGNNVFVGFKAGLANTLGKANVFVGSEAGTSNTTGTGNLFLGQQTGSNSTTGSYNLFMGNSSGNANTSGEGNTAIGDGAFLGNTTGQSNTSIGRYAGINMTTGSNNTFIGVAATAPSGSGNISNATAIGANASVTASNALILGSGVNVGIGNTAPGNKLEITTGVTNKSGLRFTNLTNAASGLINLTISLANPVVKVLTVDDNGDVVLRGLGVNLGSILGSGRQGSDLWQTKGNYLQNTSQEGVIIGSGVTKTSSDYNLFVSKGIMTEKVKVAVKNSSEWADYVFSDSYKLRSLNEVEQYIRKNKHLPGVPSAEEVAQHGIDVGKMDAKLLEKIEELTLYMLELKKENQEMKKAISELTSTKK